MNIEEIKLGLELWDNRHPIEPPSDKHAEILYDTVRLRAKMFEDNAVESVRYLLSIIEQTTSALEQIKYDYEQSEDAKVSSRNMYTEAKAALQAIRGKSNPKERGGLVNPDGGNYPLKWMSERGFRDTDSTE